MGLFTDLEKKRTAAEELARSQQEAKAQRLASVESTFATDIAAVRNFFSSESQAANRLGERTAFREVRAYDETEFHLVFDYTPSGQVQPHAVFTTFDGLGKVSVSVKRDIGTEYTVVLYEGQFGVNDPALAEAVKKALEKMVDVAKRHQP